MRRIAIDTGGTFTDCVLYDGDAGTLVVAKVPSQPKSPDKAIAEGIRRLLHQSGLSPRDIDQVAHGTTIATNAVIMDRFARAGMITTAGCRDVLEIGSQQRAAAYELRARPQSPLIPRDLRIEVAGRISAKGEEVEPLDPKAVSAAVGKLLEAGVTSIAVAGLFSFVNPSHEERIRRQVVAQAPDLYVMSSSTVSPEVREYPRFATVAVNVGLAPHLDPYLGALRRFLDETGFKCPLLIMQSNGGVATDSRCRSERAHHLVLSGPAGCAMGAQQLAESTPHRNLVMVDVGGTSSDIGMIVDGRPRTRMSMDLPSGIPLHLRHLDIETIGAGGGSIAWIDGGGALQIGPHSAGADPGPACYGIGGTEPTLTDAHLVLGRLNQERILGGEVAVSPQAANTAVQKVASVLGLTVEECALGMVRLATANMAGAIRGVAARNGDDLREFALVAAGGAGALNAVDLARELGIRHVLVPTRPGLFAAMGVLDARIRHDLVRSVLMSSDRPDLEAIREAQSTLAAQATRMLLADGTPPGGIELTHQIDVRYVGQEYAVTVSVEPGESIPDVLERFHQLHERTYGHSAPLEPTEISALRLIGQGVLGKVTWPRRTSFGNGKPVATRKARFIESPTLIDTPVFHRDQLAVGQRIEGPAIIEQLDTTTVIPPRSCAQLEPQDHLLVTVELST